MPNHVSNIIKFSNPVADSFFEQPVKGYNEEVITFKLVFLLISEPENTEYAELLSADVLNETACLKIVEDFEQKITQDRIAELLNKHEDKLPEVFHLRGVFKDGKIDFDALTLILTENQVERAFFHVDNWKPMPLAYAVAGYNNSFVSKGFAQEYNLNHIPFSSGYDASINFYGTKWAIYDTKYENGVLMFYTAWSPLNDESLLTLVDYIRNKTGMEADEHIYAEQGCGYCGRNSFGICEEDGIEIIESEQDDFHVSYDDDGEEDLELSEMPDYLHALVNYGFGG